MNNDLGVVASGLKPIEIVFRPIYDFGMHVVGYRSILRINSMELGVLMPEQYDMVARRDSRCVKLALRQMDEVMSDVVKMHLADKLPEMVTLPVPKKMLMSGEAEEVLKSHALKVGEIASKIYLELGSDVVFEDTEKIKPLLANLKKLGFKLIITEYGADYFPTLKINGLPFDCCFIDKSVTGQLIKGEKINAESIITYAGNLHLSTYFSELAGPEAMRLAERLGADGYLTTARPLDIDEILDAGDRE